MSIYHGSQNIWPQGIIQETWADIQDDGDIGKLNAVTINKLLFMIQKIIFSIQK